MSSINNNIPLKINKTVIKSPNDKNEYYRDILPNGLKYIIISNPLLDKSAVSLDVYVGSSDDPREYQGLAHCLEHTILLGTEQHPDASSFDNFLNNNSGRSNANTTIESTNYQYDVSNEALEESISMFSEFFKIPLFNKDLIEKELNAIENEFKLSFRNDTRRVSQLILFEGYKNSNLNTFTSGNLESLKKEGIRDKVIEFYKNKYDAKIMGLSVFSNKTLEELKNIVIKYFSDIKSVPDYKLMKKEILYDKNNSGYLYKIIPIKDNSFIYFIWTFNKIYRKYMTSGHIDYVNSILGHENKNSLTSYLKKKGYIYSSTSSFDTTLDVFTEVLIKLKLTDEGYNNINKIISIVLSYINYLQKEEIHKDFFEEVKQISEIDFFLDEQNNPIDFCENVSRALNITELDEPYYIASKIEEYKPDLIKEILNFLTPENLNIYFLSDKFKKEKEYLENKNKNYNIEKIYGTEYMKIKTNFSEFISDIKTLTNNEIGYPELNPFLSKDLSMIDLKKENINIDEYIYPKKMCDNDNIIWYKPVIKYNMPRVYFIAKIYISNMNLNYETFDTYFDLFVTLIEKEISDFSYFGYISDNDISIDYKLESFLIKAQGYTDSIEKYITEYFKQISKIINIQNIENIVDKLIKILDELINGYHNNFMSGVSLQTKLMTGYILKKLHLKNRIKVYEDIKNELNQNRIPEEFLYFTRNFLKKVKYEWLVEGNISYKNAERIIKKTESELNRLFGGINPENDIKHKEPLSLNEIRKQRIVKLSYDKIYRYNFTSKDTQNESSTMSVYFQTENTCFKENNIFNQELYEKYIKHYVLSCMMYYIFNEKFYDELRTQQQLGYDVNFGFEPYNNIFGFKFFVSSSKYNPDEILERINKFICEHDINKEENFTDENFENYKKALIIDFMEKPLNLNQETSIDSLYILNRSYKFDEKKTLIQYTKEILNKKDVIEFFNNYIFKKAKRLEVALYNSIKKEETNEENKMEIEENLDSKKETEFKEENKIEEDKNENKDDTKRQSEDYILPSFQNVEKVIIKDIDEFHRNCVYYDTEFY